MEFVVLFLQKLLDDHTQHQKEEQEHHDIVGFVCAFIVEKLSGIAAFTRKLRRSIPTLPLSLVSVFWERSGKSPDVFYYTALRVALACLDEDEFEEWRAGFSKEMGGDRLLTSQPKIREQVLLTLSSLFPDPNHMMNEVQYFNFIFFSYIPRDYIGCFIVSGNGKHTTLHCSRT